MRTELIVSGIVIIYGAVVSVYDRSLGSFCPNDALA